MSFVLLGILNSQASAVAQVYFLSVLGGSDIEIGRAVAIDSSVNTYLTGETKSIGSGNADFLLAKYDSAGSIQWQRVLGGSDFDTSFSVAIDSNDNIYLNGRTDSTGAGVSDFLFAKYDSAGSIQWQRTLGGSNNDQGRAIGIDSNNDIYTFGYTSSTGAGGIDFLLAKYDSSGTIQWQRTLGGSNTDLGSSITIDSLNNIYVTGYTESTGSGNADFLLAKYDSAGSIQWQRTLGGSSFDYGVSITIDSLNNIYVGGQTESTGSGQNDFLLAKYDSSGTIQWQRVLGGSNYEFGGRLSTDSQNNIYIGGYTSSTGAGSNDFIFAKYDSSGTIQWQRTLGGSGSDVALSVAIDKNDDLYISGQTDSTGAGNLDCLLAKVPNDGSLVGTYSLDGNNIIYQASSLIAGTSSLTSATSSLTSATSSLTSATSSLTSASASLAVVTEKIG